MEHFFGAHTVDNGGIHMAARRAANAGMRALQVFTAIPKYYNDRVTIRPERVTRFRETIAGTAIAPERIVVHAAYVLNTATPDPEKWIRARDGLARELVRSSTLGVGQVCFHPGAATDDDREGAAERIAQAITFALESTEAPGTRLLVENTAGAGRTMGRTPEEVGSILRHVPTHLRARTGYGLDTCHLFSSGFDLRERDSAARTLDAFERETGEPPGFFHLNDSEGALGSNKDRHMLLGDGQIGEEAFRYLLGDARTRGIPLVLETPQLVNDIADDDDSPDPYDLQMMELLQRIAS